MPQFLLALAVLAAAVFASLDRKASLTLLVVAFAGVFAGPASAAEPGAIHQVQLSALTVSLLIAVAIPLVTGIVTRFSTSSGVKGLVTLVLNAVQTLVVTAQLADGTAVISRETFVSFCLALTISIATYAGVYRPLDLTSSTPTGKLTHLGLKD